MNRRLPYLVLAFFVFAGLVLQQCGSPPPTMPPAYTGSLQILAMDSAYIKWISLDLDDITYGRHPNPYLLDNVVIGNHRLHVYDENNAGAFQMVEVSRDRRTNITVTFLAEGPYAGSVAPRFTAKTIDDQPMTLEGQRGKVVLLLFFEHTWIECIQTEVPSFNRIIRSSFTADQLTLVAINNTSSVSWLKSYRAQYGIAFPLIFDQQSQLFNLYQVGSSFANTPPTYVIIDTAGVVRYRFDAQFNRFEQIRSEIQGLL